MEKLTEKKRKWIIQGFRSGKSPTYLADVQKINRRTVYKLVKKYNLEGNTAYKSKLAGRPPVNVCFSFKKKIKEIRDKNGYGSQKIHYVMSKEGFSVSQRQIQKALDELGLTEPCEKRRGQKKYVRYQWPFSNWMWHTDWSTFEGKEYITYLDDRSRRIMAGGVFTEATQKNALHVLYQAILDNGVSPVILLSDKGTQFYNNTPNKDGTKNQSLFELEVLELGIEFWTSRRNHPQTNGKQEKFFDTMKKNLHRFSSFEEFMKWYNNGRIHDALDYKTPEETYWENL